MLESNTWNHLTVCKQMSSGSFKNVTSKLFAYKSNNNNNNNNLVIINKENLLNRILCILARHGGKIKENEKKDKYLDLKTKTTIEHESDADSKCNWCAWNDPQKLGKEVRRVGNGKTNRDNPNYSIAKIGWYTEKNPGGPWCNGCRRRKWTRRHEFKPWTRLIAFHIALIPLGKVWIQLFSLQL